MPTPLWSLTGLVWSSCRGLESWDIRGARDLVRAPFDAKQICPLFCPLPGNPRLWVVVLSDID